jgi:hypothetical protein
MPLSSIGQILAKLLVDTGEGAVLYRSLYRRGRAHLNRGLGGAEIPLLYLSFHLELPRQVPTLRLCVLALQYFRRLSAQKHQTSLVLYAASKWVGPRLPVWIEQLLTCEHLEPLSAI